MCIYSMYITEEHLDDQVKFERMVIKNNILLAEQEKNGVQITEDHPLKKTYDAQVHELKIRDLKDQRIR